MDADYQQVQQVQSYYEPALRLLNNIFEWKKQNLRNKGYDENNAAVTKTEFSQAMAHQFRITLWLAQQIVASLVKSDRVQAFGGYVKPKGGI